MRSDLHLASFFIYSPFEFENYCIKVWVKLMLKKFRITKDEVIDRIRKREKIFEEARRARMIGYTLV